MLTGSLRGTKSLQEKPLPLSFEGENIKEESKRGEAPLTKNLPLPLVKGKGIKGMGLLN